MVAGVNAPGGSVAFFVLYDAARALATSPDRILETRRHFPAPTGEVDRARPPVSILDHSGVHMVLLGAEYIVDCERNPALPANGIVTLMSAGRLELAGPG
jgi:hypothetical protein